MLHAGGVLADATLPRQTAAGMRAVFGPKARGPPPTFRVFVIHCHTGFFKLPIRISSTTMSIVFSCARHQA